MMNQYYGQSYRFGGRHERAIERGDRSAYRRPAGRSLPSSPYGGGVSAYGGCGCALNREPTRQNGRQSLNDPPREQHRALPVTGSGGCGCDGNGGVSTPCHRLMEQLRAVDFALYEVILYLDVYPHSCDALETYHKLKAQREALRKEYENVCGPLTAFSNESGAAWDWVGSPFPWEYGAE